MHILRFYEMQLRAQTASDAAGIRHLEMDRIEDTTWLTEFEKLTHTRHEGRLAHVTGLYKPLEITPRHYTFEKGCLLELKGNHLIFKNRSEWFPKLISDILFVQAFTDYDKYYLTIPKLYVRPEATPVIRRWANLMGYSTSDWIERAAIRMLERYTTLEQIIDCKRRASRAWLLRYLVVTNRLDPSKFQGYRRI